GIALLVEYLAPLLVALWARFAQHTPVRRRIWVALALALTGLGLIVDVFGGGSSLSTAGVLVALRRAVSCSAFVLPPPPVVGARPPSRSRRGAASPPRSPGRSWCGGGRPRGTR